MCDVSLLPAHRGIALLCCRNNVVNPFLKWGTFNDTVVLLWCLLLLLLQTHALSTASTGLRSRTLLPWSL